MNEKIHEQRQARLSLINNKNIQWKTTGLVLTIIISILSIAGFATVISVANAGEGFLNWAKDKGVPGASGIEIPALARPVIGLTCALLCAVLSGITLTYVKKRKSNVVLHMLILLILITMVIIELVKDFDAWSTMTAMSTHTNHALDSRSIVMPQEWYAFTDSVEAADNAKYTLLFAAILFAYFPVWAMFKMFNNDEKYKLETMEYIYSNQTLLSQLGIKAVKVKRLGLTGDGVEEEEFFSKNDSIHITNVKNAIDKLAQDASIETVKPEIKTFVKSVENDAKSKTQSSMEKTKPHNTSLIREYHQLLKDGAITQEEYDAMKKKIMD